MKVFLSVSVVLSVAVYLTLLCASISGIFDVPNAQAVDRRPGVFWVDRNLIEHVLRIAETEDVCYSHLVESGSHAGYWAWNGKSADAAAVIATERSGTFVGVYSKAGGSISLAVALTPNGIQFRGQDGSQQFLSLSDLQRLKDSIKQ